MLAFENADSSPVAAAGILATSNRFSECFRNPEVFMTRHRRFLCNVVSSVAVSSAFVGLGAVGGCGPSDHVSTEAEKVQIRDTEAKIREIHAKKESLAKKDAPATKKRP
jgi:hypothetical protein